MLYLQELDTLYSNAIGIQEVKNRDFCKNTKILSVVNKIIENTLYIFKEDIQDLKCRDTKAFVIIVSDSGVTPDKSFTTFSKTSGRSGLIISYAEQFSFEYYNYFVILKDILKKNGIQAWINRRGKLIIKYKIPRL